MVSLVAALVLTQIPAQSEVSLVSSMHVIQPGTTFDVALRLKLKKGWHVYWRNPGESGIPPTLDWHLPAGWTAGPIEWPVPHRVVQNNIANYVYEGDVLLPVRITAQKEVKAGQTYDLKATAKWLVCRETCLAGKAPVSVKVAVAGYPLLSDPWFGRLRELREQLPRRVAGFEPRAWTDGKRIGLRLAQTPSATGMAFYPADELVDPEAPQTLRTAADGRNELLLTISSYGPSKIERLKGLLLAPPGTTWAPGVKAIDVDIPLQRRKP